MTGVSAEDFWNNSSSGRFNFDDDQEQLPSIVEEMESINRESVFVSCLHDQGVFSTLPIHSLITKRNLDAVLDDMHIPLQSSVPPIEETILKMVLGFPYMLSMYRSLDQKLELLDEAIRTDDGNIILAVVLYARKTLKLSKFYQHLSKRKIAFQHYINFLMNELNLEKLADIYMYTRNFSDIVYVFYLECKDILNQREILSNLRKFSIEYQEKFDPIREFLFLQHKNFIEWQIENCFQCNSVIEQLAELSKTELSNNREIKILEFKQQLKISDFQSEWTTLNVLSALQMWPMLLTKFIKPNWLSKKNSFKSVINIQLFITTLYAHGPPRKLLEEFLSFMTDSEESLMLAKKMLCYKFIIDLYILQRDRESIVHFKECIPPQTEEYFYAENVLQAKFQDKKWKN